AVVRLGGDVVDGADLEACGLKRADRGLATRTRALNEDIHLLHAVLLRLPGGRLSGELRGVRGRLARTLETDATGRRPADDRPGGVGDRDDRFVEGGLDVGLPEGDVLLLFAARLTSGRLGCCHVPVLLSKSLRSL